MRAIIFAVLIVTIAAAQERFLAFCYHNIQESPSDPKIMSLKSDKFLQQLNWLKEHGYVPVSLDDLIKARAGRKKLPKKAVILTFDDGYATFYTRVFPVLKSFNYPAVLALVGKWIEAKGEFLYGEERRDRSLLLSLEQIKEIASSGLVEIVSHTYDLHRGVLANPYGNKEPAATSRIYDPKSKTYESDEEYRKRVYEDLVKNSEFLKRITGKKPRAIVWPFGEYNEEILQIAKSLGMEIAFTLDDGSNGIEDLDRIKRILIFGNDELGDLVWRVQNPDKEKIKRVIHIDLDYIYDKNLSQQERNLGVLLDRIKSFKINTVYLQGFSDFDGDGVAEALYFPNDQMRVRSDLLNRVAWQIRTRCGVEFIYAWMPLLAYELPGASYVKSLVGKNGEYKRVSPFDEKSLRRIEKIFHSLGKNAPINGILYHDDAFLSDYEDFSEPALAFLAENSLPISPQRLKKDKTVSKRWSELKTDRLIELTKRFTKILKRYRPSLKSARNIYARVVIEPKSEEWFAQNFEKFLKSYDYVAIMAMPYLEGAKEHSAWLDRLINRVSEYKEGLRKSVFELQSVRWDKKDRAQVDPKILADQMQMLQRRGALNFGYYPDDFLKDVPKMETVFPYFSLERYPFRRR